MNDAPTLILTPTTRLARAQRRRLAAEAAAAGRTSWPTPDLVSVGSWLGRLRDDALLGGAIDALVIDSDAARELWRQAIDTDVFIGEPRVVELAQRAWRTIHEHRLELPSSWPELLLSEDSRAFRTWSQRFLAACRERGVIDEWRFASMLPELIRARRLPLPGTVRLVGFELEPVPLQTALFEALEGAGVAVERAPAAAAPDHPVPVLALADGDAELRAAARWARERLERSPTERIGVVVPDLGERLGRVERIFAEVFDPPGFALETSRDDRGEAPWHVSMGPALADWPLIADALLLLGASPYRIDQPQAGRLLRSPWLGGERTARARAEVQLLRWAPYALTPNELVFALKQAGATRLAESLERWRGLRIEHRDAAWPSRWTERFQVELSTLGYGKGRPLNSREFQALRRWHELLEGFAALDVTSAGPLTRRQALARLAERARDLKFREADPGSPVEVLGVQEALGARFDAAWLTTLDRDTWPSAARRDPLIPGPVQAGVPSSHADGCRLRAEQELAGLRRIAPELRGSYTLGDDEIARRCTPLIPIEAVEAAEDPTITAPVALEAIAEDRVAPARALAQVRGGTAVLRDQSACPFRALAVHRLDAREIGAPRPGLDAALRGTLLHRALEAFWRDLPDRDALVALDGDALAGRIEDAAAQAIEGVLEQHRLTLGRAGQRLEQRCTERLLVRWLQLERARGPFEVQARECRIPLRFGPLELSGTIDRIDRTPAGPVLIDYKTGRTGRNDWRPDARIVDPQLPAYALSMAPAPVALAFARLRPEQLGFDGLAREPVGAEGIEPLAEIRKGAWKPFEDFDALMNDWRRVLDDLAEDFAAGQAAVAPREPAVCSRCHLHALCRIHERDPFATLEGASTDEVEGGAAR